MKDIVYNTSGLIEGLRRIGSIQLRQDLKARIRRTYFQTMRRRRYDALHMTANVAGYKTMFCSFDSLVYLFDEIFIDQQYHFNTSKMNPYIVDCGSNIGISILYFKMVYPACEILAFEPEERAFACLAANIEANGLRSVQLNQKALSGCEGPIVLFRDLEDPGSLRASVVRERMPGRGEPVLGTRLSAYIDREVDFLKMDVEGAEGTILEDLSTEGKLRAIREMVIEFHHHIQPEADSLSHILRLLEGDGFGYQIRACPKLSFKPKQFQDILIYAYRKHD